MEIEFVLCFALTLAVGVLGMVFFSWRSNRRLVEEEERDLDHRDDAKIKVDPAKRLCQNVKFVMRLKKKMRRFKERKDREKEEFKTIDQSQ